jgi:hypothetical protein
MGFFFLKQKAICWFSVSELNVELMYQNNFNENFFFLMQKDQVLKE